MKCPEYHSSLLENKQNNNSGESQEQEIQSKVIMIGRETHLKNAQLKLKFIKIFCKTYT